MNSLRCRVSHRTGGVEISETDICGVNWQSYYFNSDFSSKKGLGDCVDI